jgi:hypothetical protein
MLSLHLQVEADTPAMLDISRAHKDNVLFCIIDTGASLTSAALGVTALMLWLD